DVLLEISVRDRAGLSVGLALPVVRHDTAVAGVDVPVDAVETDVQLAAEVPLCVRGLPLVELGEGLEPRDPLAALPLPELLERDVVDLELRIRLGGEVLGRRIRPLLEKHGVDRVVARLCGQERPPSCSLRGS